MRPRLEKTEAIALRVYPYSRTSHVVTWLTPQHGRIGTLVKGAQRPKSAFIGQYDLFCTSEMVYYLRNINGLHIAKECAMTSPRTGLRKNWRSACCASYFCDLVNRIGLENTPQVRLFQLMSEALNFLSGNQPSLALLFWFELQVLAEAGMAPRLTNCQVCNAELGQGHACIAPGMGGITCHQCAKSGGILARAESAGYPSIAPDVLALLRAWQATISPGAVARTYCSPNQVLALSTFLGMLIEYHLDLQPAGRGVVLDIMKAGSF